jgi:hypothetical protein
MEIHMTEITITPWGKPDTQTVIAEGIIAVTTPSHGGIWLSPERLAEMPQHLRSCSFTHDNWFEEDTAWCAVALTWPEFFPMQQDDAAAMYQHVYAARREQVQAKGRTESAPSA